MTFLSVSDDPSSAVCALEAIFEGRNGGTSVSAARAPQLEVILPYNSLMLSWYRYYTWISLTVLKLFCISCLAGVSHTDQTLVVLGILNPQCDLVVMSPLGLQTFLTLIGVKSNRFVRNLEDQNLSCENIFSKSGKKRKTRIRVRPFKQRTYRKLH